MHTILQQGKLLERKPPKIQNQTPKCLNPRAKKKGCKPQNPQPFLKPLADPLKNPHKILSRTPNPFRYGNPCTKPSKPWKNPHKTR